AAVVLAIEPHIIIENVVLARDVVNVEARLRDDAIGVVELGRLGEMRDIAGMNDECWLRRERADLLDGFLERADGIRIGGLVEADMAVADLQEREPARRRSLRFADDADGARYPARHGPQHARSRPGHAFQDFAPADA